MLEELFSETGLLNKEVPFRPGLNVVLGRYARNKQLSGINGIGKSSLIRLVDYAFLSDGADKLFSQEKYEFLRENNHSITLRVKIQSQSMYIRRTFGNQKNVVEFGSSRFEMTEYDVKELRSILLNKMFPIANPEVRYEGSKFRTLMSFFVKDDLDQRDRNDPLEFFRGSGAVSTQEKISLNFFLLGLPNKAQFDFGSNLKLAKEKRELAKSLQKRIEEDTGQKLEEFKSKRAGLEGDVAALEKDLSNFEFLSRYKDIEEELSQINVQIEAQIRSLHGYSRKLAKLRNLSLSAKSVDTREVASMYAELSETFAQLVKKSLDEILEFKQTLIENRIRYNLEREKKFESDIKKIEDAISTLEKRRAALLRRLDEQGALDSLANTYEELLAKKSDLDRAMSNLKEIDAINEQLGELDVKISKNKQAISNEIRSSEDVIDRLRLLFREILSNAVHVEGGLESPGYFDISPTPKSRKDQLPFQLTIDVPKSDALGRLNVKLVAYDLLVFLHAIRENRELPRFLIHDGAFHGTSKRTVVDILNFIHAQSIKSPGFQYIVTFNEDELYIPAERMETDGSLAFDLNNVTIAKYADTEDQMLFKHIFG